jgi:hypothetical protein
MSDETLNEADCVVCRDLDLGEPDGDAGLFSSNLSSGAHLCGGERSVRLVRAL